MATQEELAKYTDELLDTEATPDYPNALNGIQLANEKPVRGITAAVDFSIRTIKGTIEKDANLLIVHHGMFWAGLKPITEAAYKKLQLLMEHDIGVYSSHLPLDRHPTIGNNALLAQKLGLEPTEPFARYKNIFVGTSGSADVETAALAQQAREFAKSHGGDIRTTPFPNRRRTRKWAICTGAGASAETLEEARTMGVDTLIVGEGAHWTAVHAEERDLVIIYAGHYATETLGVRALAQHVGERFNIPWSFIDASTGL